MNGIEKKINYLKHVLNQYFFFIKFFKELLKFERIDIYLGNENTLF